MRQCQTASPGTYCGMGTAAADGSVPCPVGHYCLGTYHNLSPCTVPEVRARQVLQCVAVCCSGLQCAAVCCSVL